MLYPLNFSEPQPHLHTTPPYPCSCSMYEVTTSSYLPCLTQYPTGDYRTIRRRITSVGSKVSDHHVIFYVSSDAIPHYENPRNVCMMVQPRLGSFTVAKGRDSLDGLPPVETGCSGVIEVTTTMTTFDFEPNGLQWLW